MQLGGLAAGGGATAYKIMQPHTPDMHTVCISRRLN